MTWGGCNDPYQERRDGERAYSRGYMTSDERERYRYPLNECDEEFARGYRNAEREADERRRDEERAEERRASERAESLRYEECMEQQAYEQAMYDAQPQYEPPPEEQPGPEPKE